MSTDVANSGRELRSQLADIELGQITWVAATGSTNADLAEQARRGVRQAVLLAESQTSGRGRRDRRWEAPPGENILLSVLRTTTLDAEHLGAMTVSLAVAAAEACGEAGVGDVGLKWPNDIVRPSGKVGGLLAEVQRIEQSFAVVAGIGLNVGWPAPGEGPPGASRLGSLDRVGLVAAVIRRFVELVDRCERDGTGELRAAFERWCVTIGQRVALHHDVEGPDAAATIVEGQAVGVDERFRILVSSDDAAEPVAYDVGDVVHLRPAD